IRDLASAALAMDRCPGGRLPPLVGCADFVGVSGFVVSGPLAVDLSAALGAVFCPAAHAVQGDAAAHTGADVPPLARRAAQGLGLFVRRAHALCFRSILRTGTCFAWAISSSSS